MNISKAGDTFALREHVVSSLIKAFDELKKEDNLSGGDLAKFASRGAYYLGEINAIHPFREGERAYPARVHQRARPS